MKRKVLKEEKNRINKQKTYQEILNCNENEEKKEKSGIAALEAKIRQVVLEKERRLAQEMKDREELELGPVRQTTEVLNVATALKMHFSSRNVQNLFKVKAIEQIYKKNKTKILSKGEINQTIDLIVKYSNGWLKNVKNEAGMILRMDRSKSFKEVVGMLKEGLKNEIL